MRKFVLLIMSGVVLAGASCHRHPAKESKYFFTHHLPKAQKKEMKKHFAALLNAPKPAGDAKAGADGDGAPSLFPGEGM